MDRRRGRSCWFDIQTVEGYAWTMARVTVVSNRLPVTVKQTPTGPELTRSSGGLATGLNQKDGRRGCFKGCQAVGGAGVGQSHRASRAIVSRNRDAVSPCRRHSDSV